MFYVHMFFIEISKYNVSKRGLINIKRIVYRYISYIIHLVYFSKYVTFLSINLTKVC